MHQEIRLHGHVDDTIEYFATAAARDVYRTFFYEFQDHRLRFFSPGNELVLDPSGLSHRGNGGTFCEYMFGVDQPLPDLAKGDVRNRLVLYGASYNPEGSLLFTDRTDGHQSFEKVFFEGNAICNYFFFLTGSTSGPLKQQQEEILRLLGKQLKRTGHLGAGDDVDLINEVFFLLGHRSALYVVKLIHKKHKDYHDAFQKVYSTDKELPESDMEDLRRLGDDLGIDRYQQERIRIDVMYRHPENKRIVDEYKNILVDCNRRGRINQLENARLTRLRTLSVRNKIPSSLFFTLDEMLKHDQLIELEEQDYIAETRQILAGLFLHDRQIDAAIDREDMIKLLHDKRRASENRDHNFEQILLETGKACDEKTRDGADITLLENFSYIITYFDRFDNTSTNINKLAFMENVRCTEEMIRSLLGNKKAFDQLQTELFNTLFFTGILDNEYLGLFGRKKIRCLQQGLTQIEEGSLTIKGLIEELTRIDQEEMLYNLLLDRAKSHIGKSYSRYNSRAEQEALRGEVTEELRSDGLWQSEIPRDLFQDVLVNIKKEAIYLHSLLPKIVAEKDVALREDFLENSGLDRFYVEELERQYFEANNLETNDLNKIRKGLNS